jgi:hypothetical protein
MISLGITDGENKTPKLTLDFRASERLSLNFNLAVSDDAQTHKEKALEIAAVLVKKR